jgi:hypothetical protein
VVNNYNYYFFINFNLYSIIILIDIICEKREDITVITLFKETITGFFLLYYNDKCIGLKCDINNSKVIYDQEYLHPINFVHLNIIQTCLNVKNLYIKSIKIVKLLYAKTKPIH